MEYRRGYMVVASSWAVLLRLIPLITTVVCTTHHASVIFFHLLWSDRRGLLLEHDRSHIVNNILNNVVIVNRLSAINNDMNTIFTRHNKWYFPE